jgi:hypothetical protein
VCVCILAFVTGHAHRIFPVPCYTVILACVVLPYFFTLSQNGTIFGKKVTEHGMCPRFLYNVCLIQRKIRRKIYINFHTSSFKCPLFLSYFNKISFFATISEKSSNTKFHKNATSDSRKDDGRTDGRTHKVSGRFSKFWTCTEKYGREHEMRDRNVNRTV